MDSERRQRWVFLPGLDGTGRLFDGVVKELPAGVDASVVSYPCGGGARAAELVGLVEAALPAEGPYVVIAESFSGPLALRAVGNRGGGGPVALVLCASFGRAPIPRAACVLWGVIAGAVRPGRIPDWMIRRNLVGEGRDELIPVFCLAIGGVSGEALASRFRVLGEFSSAFVPPRVDVPILFASVG